MRLISNGTQGSATLPVPAAATGTPGYAKTDAPSSLVTPTQIWPDDINILLAENMAILAAAGVTPDNTGANTAQMLQAIRQLDRYSFDELAPPGSPISLLPGGKLTITFTGVSSIPLHVASAPGIYRVTSVIAANNTTNSDWMLKPNDTTYGGAFASYGIENSDANLTSFGSATTGAGITGSTVSPFLGNIPLATNVFGQSSFGIDIFSGPNPPDTLNDIGPSIMELIISTFTAAKMLKYFAAIVGGPSSGFGKWNDTTTPWTSLGTLSDSSSTSLTGTTIIERLT